MNTRNYYELLDIPKDATSREITQAYRRLARQHHPDHQGDGDFMRQLNEMRDILLDPEKRVIFDAELDASGELADTEITAGYLATKSESFSAIYRRRHAQYTREYEAQPIQPASIAVQYLHENQTLQQAPIVSLSIAGVDIFAEEVLTRNSVERLTTYAKQAPEASFSTLLNFFQSDLYRQAAIAAFLVPDDVENGLQQRLRQFDGEQKTVAEIETLRQRFIDEGMATEQGRFLKQKLTKMRLLHRYESDLNSQNESFRESAFQALNWVPTIASFVGKEALLSLFLRVAHLFQLSSLQQALSLHERIADEHLALMMCQMIDTILSRFTPYEELSILSSILDLTKTFRYALPRLANLVSAIVHRIEVLADVFPFFTPIQPIVDLVAQKPGIEAWMRRYLSGLLEAAQMNQSRVSKEKVLYYAYEALLNRWLRDIDDPVFATQLRLSLMLALLEKQGWGFKHLAQRLDNPWVFVDRDEAGWMRRGRNFSLPSSLGLFQSLDGLEVNYLTGNIQFLLTPWHAGMPVHQKLFTQWEVYTILSKRLSGAFFSLDPVDPDMKYHPFNRMRFLPAIIDNTPLMQTMFLTDYLLKFITVSQEVQGRHPYGFRSIHHLLMGLPEYLQKMITDFHQAPHVENKAHRFWIEAEDANYTMDYTTQPTLKIAVPPVKMVIKKHLMIRDEHGNLIDAEHETDGWPIYVCNREQYGQIEAVLREKEERAIIIVDNSLNRRVRFWEEGEFSEVLTCGQESSQLFQSIRVQARDARGRLISTSRNNDLCYEFTSFVTNLFHKPHHYSAEYLFARAMTQHYDEFAQYFPEFGRLKAFSQIMIFVYMLEHVFRVNQTMISDIQDKINNTALWLGMKQEVERLRIENEKIFSEQFLTQKSKNQKEIDAKIDQFKTTLSVSALARNQESRLNSLCDVFRRVYSGDDEITEYCNKLYQANEASIINDYGYDAWYRAKNDIYQQIQNKRQDFADELNKEKCEALTHQITLLLPDISWKVNGIVADIIDRRNTRELADLLAKKEYNEHLKHYADLFPFPVTASEVEKMISSYQAADRLADRLTQWQLSSLRTEVDSIHQKKLDNIQSEKNQLHSQVQALKRLEKQLSELGAGKTMDAETTLPATTCVWVPASIHQSVDDGYFRLIYGGVNLQLRVEALDELRGKQLIQEVFSPRKKRERKEPQEIMRAYTVLRDAPAGQLIELDRREKAAEALAKKQAEERRIAEERERERRRVEEQRRREFERQEKQRAEEVRLANEREEKLRRKREIAQKEAEERERIRQKEFKKTDFLQKTRLYDPNHTGGMHGLDADVIDRVQRIGDLLRTRDDDSSGGGVAQSYAEGLRVISEDAELFHRWIRDERGNLHRRVTAIFYPADPRNRWPAITASDYWVRMLTNTKQDAKLRELRQKGLQGSVSPQKNWMTSVLMQSRLSNFSQIIYDKTILANNSPRVLKQSATQVLQRYEARMFKWSSSDSKATIRELRRLIHMHGDNSAALVVSMTNLMHEKNTHHGKSRLRDELLVLWQAGLYSVAFQPSQFNVLLQQDANFFSTPLHPIQARSDHPWSQDTVGTYLLRIAVEENNHQQISALLEKGVKPPVDVALPPECIQRNDDAGLKRGGSSSGSSSSSSDEGSVVSLGDSKVTMYKRKKVKGNSLQDMSDALRHRVVLALKEAGILDHEERLTERAVRESKRAIKEGAFLENPTVVTELTKNGSQIEEWGKFKTETITISTGQRIQVHFYKNKLTEQVNYTHQDFKVKNPVNATMTDGLQYNKKITTNRKK